MRISIFGLGYVGCVSLGCLANIGHKVIGVDIKQEKVNLINQGISPIIEKDLDSIIREQRECGNVSATSDGVGAVQESDLSFICVGTPSTERGHLNLNAIYNVSSEIAEAIRSKDLFHVVVIRSTVPPGTNKKVAKVIMELSGKKTGRDFAVLSNPEFLREGTAVRDFYHPPYTLVGSDSERATDLLREVYEGIDEPFVVTVIEVAEMMKYANNAFHALKITFANEIGRICDRIGVDSHKLMEIFCLDTKLNISAKYLKPGFAYGGSCLPKDLLALRTMAHDRYISCPVIESIENSNEVQKEMLLNELIRSGKKRIGFLGLAFKAGTDDLRNSPIVDVIEILLGKGFDVKIYDRNVYLSKLIGANKEYIMKKIPYISQFLMNGLEEVIKESEIIVIVNNEPEFRNLDKELCEEKSIYDLAGAMK